MQQVVNFYQNFFKVKNNNNNTQSILEQIHAEKSALKLQLDVTREQLTAVTEKCNDSLIEINNLRKLREKNEMQIQKEFQIRHNLENERLKLLEAFSNLKIENQALRKNLQDNVLGE